MQVKSIISFLMAPDSVMKYSLKRINRSSLVIIWNFQSLMVMYISVAATR
jgi:hypothetical protein